jgi:hypothetical protein
MGALKKLLVFVGVVMVVFVASSFLIPKDSQ